MPPVQVAFVAASMAPTYEEAPEKAQQEGARLGGEAAGMGRPIGVRSRDPKPMPKVRAPRSREKVTKGLGVSRRDEAALPARTRATLPASAATKTAERSACSAPAPACDLVGRRRGDSCWGTPPPPAQPYVAARW